MRAGSTLGHQPLNEAAAENTWDRCGADNFELRVGPNYDRNKQKGPSPESLMELVGVDLIRCESRIDHIASKVTFPPEWSEGCDPGWTFPHLFIVNVQLPSEFTTSFFTEITDGPGWSLVLYYKIRPDGEGGASPSEAALLWARYCDGICATPPGSSNPWIGRFKVIITCLNIEQYGLPNFIASYNSKPVLIKNTASYFRQDGYIELDVNVHKFGSVPKKALQTQIERLHLMEFNIGFCIESRGDAEMPECIFGCARLNKPNQNKAPSWKDVSVPPPAPPAVKPAPVTSPVVAPPESEPAPAAAETAKEAPHAFITNGTLAHTDVDHGVVRLVSFLRHRNALLEIWNLLAGHDTSLGGSSPTDMIPPMDLVSPSGDTLQRNPVYRQCCANGNVIEHMPLLFETADVVKPYFEKCMATIAAECTLSAKGRASSSSPTSTRSGLVIADVKSVSRVAKKIREKYLHVIPGPACSWVFDVLRASFVCDTQDQIKHVYETILQHADMKIVRVKNRFQKPTAAGFRDILLNVQLSVPGSGGQNFPFICEVQITHVDLRQYEIEHNTRALYYTFWPLLSGTDENKSKKLTILQSICAIVSPVLDSLVPSSEKDSLHRSLSQVRDSIAKHYDHVHLKEDIEALRDWTQVLEAIDQLELAENNQRKVVKLMSAEKCINRIAVSLEELKLGNILAVEQKYDEAVAVYESGVKGVGEVFGKENVLVKDALNQIALLICRGEGPSAQDVEIIRNRIFRTDCAPDKITIDKTRVEDTVVLESERLTPSASLMADVQPNFLGRQHSETHHSAYDSAPQNYSTKPPEQLEPIPDLWDLVSSSDSDFGDDSV